MLNFLYLVSIILLLIYALESGDIWISTAVAAYIVAGGTVIRWKNRKEERQAYFKIVDKGKSRSALAMSLVIFLLASSYYLYRMEADYRPNFFILIIASLVSGLISETHKIKYLLNDTELVYKKKKITYDQILQLREDANHLIIDTTKYINHIKIKKDLINEELRAFLENKIRLNGAKQQP